MNSIFHRISVRKYEDKPVEKEKIMQILKAGMHGPITSGIGKAGGKQSIRNQSL